MIKFSFNMPLSMMALYGSIMILVVFLLRALLKKRLPKFVFPTLWGLVLIRFLVPFSLSSPISMPVPKLSIPSIYDSVTRSAINAVVTSGIETNINTATQIEEISLNWTAAVAIIFVLGGLATAGILFYQKNSYSKRLKSSFLVEHNETINGIIREMGMGHILVFSSDSIASPLVCGLLNPRIYLPTSMDFNDKQLLRHILAHEIVHIKHKDNWIKLAMVVTLCLNWYNPLVWMMSKWLSADLETACDSAVLKLYGSEEKQSYAASLLNMAVTGNRSPLLYSAFSKTEVERRIKGILNYKRVTAVAISLSMIFILGSTVALATGGQAPFSEYLTSFCASSNSNWGIKATVTRGIELGKNAQKRAENVIFDILDNDETKDPDVIIAKTKTALAAEFKVEKNAFAISEHLIINDDELKKEYASQSITKSNDGIFYKGEKVRYFTDEELGIVHSNDNGEIDISIERNRMGNIINVKVLREGDSEFDRRTRDIERAKNHVSYGNINNNNVEASEVIVLEKGTALFND